MEKVLAFDFGTERIGVAVSDEVGVLARPLPFIKAKPPKEARAAVRRVIETETPSRILVGLPRHMDGGEGDSAGKARDFATLLEKLCGADVTIQLVDERLSTVQASRLLQEAGHDSRKQRTRIDSASAAVLLQGYLDAQAPLPQEDFEDDYDED